MKILITAGPTREALDPVRFISNRSSGKMGYAIAAAAAAREHHVVLISGPVCLPTPMDVTLVPVTTAEEMLVAVQNHVTTCDALVMAAAVADWRPKWVAAHKWKKREGPPQIEWEATPDILARIAPQKKSTQLFFGFAAETDHLHEEAQRKLRDKKLDVIAANDVSRDDIGFEVEHNQLTLFFASRPEETWPRMTKRNCAEKILLLLEEMTSK